MTSGTTALPKVIPYTQRMMAENAYRNLRIFRYAAGDRSLQILPLSPPVRADRDPLSPFCRCDGHLHAGLYPPDFLPLVRATRANCYGAVPALHQAIHGDLKKVPPEALREIPLRFMVTGSSSLPDTVRQELEAMLQSTMIEVYGMSEALYISVNVPYRSGSAGIPVIESLRIVDGNGTASRRARRERSSSGCWDVQRIPECTGGDRSSLLMRLVPDRGYGISRS